MRENSNNSSLQRKFHLLAFTRDAVLQTGFFYLILIMYLLATLGNMLITTLVYLVSYLQTPMYFFLCNLSVQDIVYVSAILPKLMNITITGDTSISFQGCIAQVFLFASCLCTEFLLLTSMAYDRYVAICLPLHYSLIMNKSKCALLASVCWIIGALNSLLYSYLIANLSFYNSQEIDHFFCDIKTLLKLSYSDRTVLQDLIYLDCFLLGFLPLILILISYGFIIYNILKIQSTAGRLKSFSSCFSHVIVVILFFGTSVSSYIKEESIHSQEQYKLMSLLYVALVPLLNPLVYSLRNKQVLNAMKVIFKI